MVPVFITFRKQISVQIYSLQEINHSKQNLKNTILRKEEYKEQIERFSQTQTTMYNPQYLECYKPNTMLNQVNPYHQKPHHQ
jgi:hypothetical protein